MALEVSRYEPAASAFLEAFPVGTTLGAEEILAFAQGHANGLAPDLLLPDPAKRLSSLRRHLNHGGQSRNFAEEARFVIEVLDAKRGMFTVRKFADHAMDLAHGSLAASVKGSMLPPKRNLARLEAIKKEELEEEARKQVEEQTQLLLEQASAFGRVMREQVYASAIQTLKARGITEEQARVLMQLSGDLVGYEKLLKLTGK